MASRRDFLRGVTAAASLPASWHAFRSALQAAPAKGSEPFWDMVKAQFPLEPGLIYLNAANVCPASRPVMDRHLQYLRDFHANPSFQNRAKYDGMRETVRNKAAALLRVSADEIALTRNTSEGTNIVVQGLELKAGDEVIITDHNHPSNNDSWKVRAKREGFRVVSLPVPAPAPGADQLLGGFEKAITPRTKVIAVTHLTNTTGLLYPAKAITEMAHRRGIHVHLDGAQSFGLLDVDLRAIGCDSYTASAHKWPMGPLEAGILYVKQERIAAVWPSVVTAGWSDTLKGARKFEVLGQRDDPRVIALEPCLDFLAMIGLKEVEARARALAQRAMRGLKEIPGVTLRTNLEPELSGAVIKFHVASVPTRQAYDTLYAKNRLGIAATNAGPTEGLRFSPHIYNSMDEIDQAVAAVRALVRG
ncbi:MAG: aminotransferase class V-fold PLP-dependent enzyme [Bryobacterales bacterium]|nr:aminotransferase class V-fold PLP-dependent enzyme [Bryobacterales bacterium]